MLVASTGAVVVAGQSGSSAAPGNALNVPVMAGSDNGLAAPKWPAGDFAGGLPKTRSVTRALTAPATPELATPDDGAVVASTRPELRVAPVSGDVQYRFVLGTGPSPEEGQVATSGWISQPYWTVPAGVLADGGQYSWTAQVRDAVTGTAGTSAPARALFVNLRLGMLDPAGAVPVDYTGPLMVNLATGNVATQLMTPVVITGMGPQMVFLNYNSLTADQSGLVGSYFAGDSTTGIADSEQPVAVRTDRQLSFFWGAKGTVPAGINGNAYRVRWQGYIRVPSTGVYDFGGIYHAGLRIKVADQQVFDGWTKRSESTTAASYGGGLRLEGGRSYPVQVDYRASGFPSFMQLWVRAEGGEAAPVPSAWLSPASAALPPGWTASPDPSAFVSASVTTSSVTLTSGQGDATTFVKDRKGNYRPVAGSGKLTRDAKGNLTATSAEGVVSVFDAAGRLQSTRTGKARPGTTTDRATGGLGARAAGGNTAAGTSGSAPTKLKWTGGDAKSPARLTEMSTAEGGSPIQFHYSGSEQCADTTAPVGYVCAISIPDGSTSYLSYNDRGQLVRFRNPGNDVTDMAYNRANQLVKFRPTQVMDWIGVDVAKRDSDAAAYLLNYDSQSGRVVRLATPEPGGFPRPDTQRTEHFYAYGADSTEVRIAGLAPAQGWARRVTRDIGGRKLTDTDATNRTTSFVWGPGDEPLVRTDPAGRRTTTGFGPEGMSTYGPAPVKCFNPDGSPVDPAPTGCADMPVTRMAMNFPTITTTTVESGGLPDKKVDMTLNEFGMPVSRTLDPGGLNLVNTFRYDEFFRMAAVGLPTGAETTYSYYGMDETATAPCEPELGPQPQWGRVSLNQAPNPAVGAPRQDRNIYNKRGREVGKTFGADQWVCAFYDERDRTMGMKIPGTAGGPARDTHYEFAVGGDPLTLSGTDPAGTIRTSSDLIGRPVAYTDVHGVHTQYGYDRAGRIVTTTTTPANSADTAQRITRSYDDAGRLLKVQVGSQTLATATYNAGGELASVTYGNGTALTSVGRDLAGRVVSLKWRLANGRIVASTVTRTRAGTVVDESLNGVDARPGGPNYRYDAAGRLTEAWVKGHTFSYDYMSAAAATCPAGTEVTDYCYDAADRLLAASGAHPVSAVTHTEAGHVSE
ncbi:MAG TPA: PA14 domain-containing protein, partial [Micromonospora sp.]